MKSACRGWLSGGRVLRSGVKQAATDDSFCSENTGAEEGKGGWLDLCREKVKAIAFSSWSYGG
jgi:hypothetical protein